MDKKVVLVTGGFGGIGFATGKAFIKSGYDVLLTDIAAAPSPEVLESFHELNRISSDAVGNMVLYPKCDIRSEEMARDLFEFCKKAYGRLDVLVTAHGVYSSQKVSELTEEEIDRIMDTNFKGVVLCAREALYLMKTGVIINVGSSVGIAADSDSPIYSASKAAIHQFTKCLAQKCGRTIRVNVIAPGPVDTPLLRKAFNNDLKTIEEYRRMALRGIASCDEIATMIVFMASDACNFMNGAIVPFDGGESILYAGEPPK
ncbi:MAG: hypothetical protein A3I89_01325 [Candidatus Harrisonbacteria bacterium RIFCSPLOWO2_02_FULL_41_11]|uniref:Short-chain dehydrogenase n=1 Tax=Candidatus Harrisonbacteria bacterium RIFCSPHIGHO2_02_FULL_42_16 TaxID=1798404 RepID=A0A1G1ZIC1_9BACT|nr:MAG: hypothetical protein A3B92_00815 [Candidatus Harrisonbacteria bacterium RIFCSPHIGHO2_02_FULL_42_16]OGY67611.1 MAG: hypothetical protein A3I89_01325 [Candidatus Harrisonbacteria bacterium RIFCSPLOWO2_02_FULL_41_11]